MAAPSETSGSESREARAAAVSPWALPVAFLAFQGGFFWLAPRLADNAAYVFMMAAPVLASWAALYRAHQSTSPARIAWYATALALFVWGTGAFGNFWQEVILGRLDEMYRSAMLAFNLSVVPIVFVLASAWRATERRLTRLVDATLALALGYGYFVFTWSLLHARGNPDAEGVSAMLWLMDVQNLFIAAAAATRWAAAEDVGERDLMRALTIYTAGYFVIALANNHYFVGELGWGAQASSVVTVVFALVAGLALQAPSAQALRHPPGRFVRSVRSASPLFLACALLIVSLFVIRVDYTLGTAGVLIAVLGHGLRSTATQVRHIERVDSLQRDRSALRELAWTDALTGVSNRRFLDRALAGDARGEHEAGRLLSVLMIDIDQFKPLNDRYGHAAGDHCLRAVAGALQESLVRPGDVLARYGGEEFVALLHGANLDGALIVAERMRAAVQSLGIENADSDAGIVTISIGAASSVSVAGLGALELVEVADRALYAAKLEGRNRVKAAPLAA